MEDATKRRILVDYTRTGQIKRGQGVFVSAVAFLILWLLVPTSFGEVRFVEGKDSDTNIYEWTRLEITGNISRADIPQLIDALPNAVRHSNLRTAGTYSPLIVLNSRGGDVEVAVKMGHLFRKLSAHIFVKHGAECSSACVLVLAGGVKRNVNGRIGLHRPIFDQRYFAKLTPAQARTKYSELETGVRAYLKQMGMPDALFERMLAIPSRNVIYLNDREIAELRIDGNDPATEELEQAYMREGLGKDMSRRIEGFTDCLNSGSPRSVCENRFNLK